MFDICCLNSAVPGTNPKYLVSADFDVYPDIPKGCEWISENTGWLFEMTYEFITKEKHLSWCEFSSSVAVNFAILRGYKEIYLAGIDLIEDGKPLKHYDGIINSVCTAEFRCRNEKKYIKDLCKKNNIKIYNLNKECDWLEFADIGIVK